MRTDIVTVWAVHEWPDPRGFTVFVIRTSGPVVTTTNQFAASLCQREIDLSQQVRLTWDDTRRGRLYLEHVELDASAVPRRNDPVGESARSRVGRAVESSADSHHD